MGEFALKVALVIFVTKLIDPFAALPALVAGYFCRAWWQVVVSAAAIGIVVEMILVLFEKRPEFTKDDSYGCVGGRRVVQPGFCFQNLARQAYWQD